MAAIGAGVPSAQRRLTLALPGPAAPYTGFMPPLCYGGIFKASFGQPGTFVPSASLCGINRSLQVLEIRKEPDSQPENQQKGEFGLFFLQFAPHQEMTLERFHFLLASSWS